ncbi:MAG: hypothetical protein LBG52_06890 [Candidatus Peribacteria bacterium]|jgi:hypothetical protein|nr:hypothetical protein [Candidatus Peribacteria bacterium]
MNSKNGIELEKEIIHEDQVVQKDTSCLKVIAEAPPQEGVQFWVKLDTIFNSTIIESFFSKFQLIFSSQKYNTLGGILV